MDATPFAIVVVCLFAFYVFAKPRSILTVSEAPEWETNRNRSPNAIATFGKIGKTLSVAANSRVGEAGQMLPSFS